MSTTPLSLAVGLLLVAAVPAAADEKADAAATVLKTHCHRCHGEAGSVEGGFNYAADLPRLVARKKVTPGDPGGSRLLQRIDDGTMPPPGETPRPSTAEVGALRAWVTAGAPAGGQPPPRAVLSPGDVNAAVLADLSTLDRRARRFQRYFSLAHLHNAGLGADELQTHRNALAKLVNSLSWHSKISLPVPVDPAKTVLRIDLRWFQWDAAAWNRVLQEYPFGVIDDATAARAAAVDTATRLPVVRADWFVATASRAPLYYDLLQLPSNATELERQLRVDATLNVLQERAVRVGFNGSGVSRFNRILERHDSAQGMYWRTYDFDEPPANLSERANGALVADRRNVFAFPLGPANAREPFRHAGGEAIFSLPNGLHAYYLMKADNTRLDKGPIAVVSDPKRPDRAVEAGVSCMSCHTSGVLPKADQVRDHVGKNPGAFARADADTVRALYAPKDESLKLMKEDADRYAAAVAKTGAKVSKFEAVSTITLKYEADLDIPAAAAEVGLAPEAFRTRISGSEALAKHVGALRPAGGTVSRQIWVQAFGDVARELGLGVVYQPGGAVAARADGTGELDPLDGTGGSAAQVAFAADGRRAVVASGDRAVRLVDVEGRRDLKRFDGHAAGVWSVALSADERFVLSGSLDETARLWDISSGRELRVYSGHDSLVSAVAFTPDGKWAVSGGYDGVVAVWKVGSGDEVWRVADLGPVAAVAVDPENGFVVAAAGRLVRVFRLADGEPVWQSVPLNAPAASLALSADGKWLAAGDEAGGVHAFQTGRWVYQFHQTGHAGPVRGVAIREGGRWMASAGADGTVRLWDLRAGREAGVFRKHAGPVVSVGFLANGRRTVSADRDGVILPWTIDKLLAAEPPKPVPPPVPDMIPYAKE